MLTDPREDTNSGVLSRINDITLIVGFSTIVLVIIIFFVQGCHRLICPCARGADAPNYFTAIRYIHSVTDFWTDIFLCYTLYIYEKWRLFYASLTFTIVPLLFSIGLVVYWIRYWRKNKLYSISRRIVDYLDRYAIVLGFLSLIGDFHTTIWLVQSKLFYAKIFNFPLKKREFETLIIWRFINVTLLEVKIRLPVEYTWSVKLLQCTRGLVFSF